MLYISLGTNIGNKERNLVVAIRTVNKQIGTVVSQSVFISTEPWGFESDNSFLNACIAVDTKLTPEEVLRRCQRIERTMGRRQKSSVEQLPDGTQKTVYHDRIIDIDILIYDDIVMNTPSLTIPHALMHKRRFVLEPLAQIASELKIPGTTMSVGEMLKALEARS